MKKITAFLMIFTALSLALFTSCSSDGKTSPSDVTKSEVKGETKNDKTSKFDWEDALNTTISYVATSSKADESEIENNINYKILPSKNGEIFFVRYKVEGGSEGDLLVFKDGKKYSLKDDGAEVFKKYNKFFSVDITDVSDNELLKQPDCINGGYGSDFEV